MKDVTELDTFPKLLAHQSSKIGNKPAIREKNYGIWQTWTWREVDEEVRALACGLAARGFESGEKLAIVGENRPRLYWGMSAAQCLGGVPVPTYHDSVAEEMRYVIEHVQARYVLAEDQEQVDKILEVRDGGVPIDLIIYDDVRGLRDYDAGLIVSYEQIQQEGREYAKQNPEFLTTSIESGKGSDDSVILYTSGTTGNPKGVVLTYDNLIFVSEKIAEVESLNSDDSVMAYLPMAWVVDHFLSYALQHVTGYCVCCPESEETSMADKTEIGPSFHFTSPRVLENHRTNLMTRIEDAATLKQKMFAYFTGVAGRVGTDLLDGKPVSLKDRLLYGLGKILVYEPLKNVLGYGKTRVTYTAGEAIGPDMFQFYRSLGINLKQVYGQTEAGPFLTAQLEDCVRSDTVGVQLPGVEVKIADDGEVVFRSPGAFKSYYKNPEATSDTKTEDGWVHTGDAGFFDHEGQLKIIDRVKDVGKMSNGSLFAPKYIENKLKFSPYILEAVTVGDGRDRCVAMVNMDIEAVGNWAERRNIPYASYQELAAHPDVYELFRKDIEGVNLDLSEDDKLTDSQIHRFLILHKELDADDGELTRTRKVRRRIIAERYEPLINGLYGDGDECFIETQVRFEDGRTGSMSATLHIADVKTYDSVGKAA